jgi:tellurite resistance protein TerC
MEVTMKKLIVSIVGTFVLCLGVVMIVLPGPAIVLIPLGIAILSLEFEWARKLLEWGKRKLRATRNGSGDDK